MTFNDQKIQQQIDTLSAMEKTPEFIENNEIMHREYVRRFWRVYVPLCIVLAFILGILAPMVVYMYLPGLASGNYTESILISTLVSTGVAIGLYPKRY